MKKVLANGYFSDLAVDNKLIKTDDAFFLAKLINILIELLVRHISNQLFKLFFLDGLSVLLPVFPTTTTLFLLVTYLLLVTTSPQANP